MRLISMRPSHYVERARWALELAGLSYEEDCYPPVIHLMGVLPVRPKGITATSVPVLITPDKGVLTDSRDIVHYASAHPDAKPQGRSLYPDDPELRKEVEEVERLCADGLGVWTRVVFYHFMFPHAPALIATMCQGAPVWRANLFYALYWPIKSFMASLMAITPANAEESLRKIRALFDDLGKRLEGGKRFLVGDSFTAADLTFAAMAVNILLPEEFGAGIPDVVRKAYDARLVQEMRDTPAGKHALEMYRMYRRRT